MDCIWISACGGSKNPMPYTYRYDVIQGLPPNQVLLNGKTLDGVMGISSLLFTFLSRSRADIGALEELLVI